LTERRQVGKMREKPFLQALVGVALQLPELM
jgi:hypothetical protein